MKLFDSKGPNPKTVRMFAAEKGIVLDRVAVDMIGGENRRQPFLDVNPLGQLPVLQLDDGTIITEVVAICEYLDEISDAPSLLGDTPEQRALARMWARRLDLNIMAPMADGYRFAEGLSFFKDRIHCIPEAAPGLKAIAKHWLSWLDGEMKDRSFICGQQLTLADIMLFANVDFFRRVGQPLDPAWTAIVGWHERMNARPSARA